VADRVPFGDADWLHEHELLAQDFTRRKP